MHPRRARYVTVCQQLLVLGVICAALTPAATLLDLQIVPGDASASRPVPEHHGAAMAAYVRAQSSAVQVPTRPVDPTVHEVPLTASSAEGPALRNGGRAVAARASTARSVLSEPEPVSGYGAVGVTWAHGEAIPADGVTVQVRTETDGAWSGWQPVPYHDEHGPDAGTREARHARPGTDAIMVGEVGHVQVKVATAAPLPDDLELAVIDPGTPTATRAELPAIDTGADTGAGTGAEPAVATPGAPSGDVALARATYTPKPQIYSRAQWGADERLRDKPSLHYYEVHAGFVHHTVTANGYSADQVPAMIRAIYAYHTKSKGWSDIGYNFLVDRFGRIWEGRYGGVDRAVVGAHTLGFNDNAFAASALGNYEVTKPSSAMVQAYGALFGWKLSLYGVDASSTHQYVTSRFFAAINGHRDANPTECPGKYLYAKLPQIRRLAAQAQRGWSGRGLESNLAGSAQPDLIVRRASDGQGVVLPIVQGKAGRYQLGSPIATGLDLSNANRIMNAGDWDRDGFSDVIYRDKTSGRLMLARGDGKGHFAAPAALPGAWAKVHLLAAVGDMTGDGWPDLMGQQGSTGPMTIWAGNGTRGFKTHYTAYAHLGYQRQIPIGRWDSDGAPDTLFRKGSKLSLLHGNGPGGLTGSARTFGVDLAPYDWVVGVHDVGLTGHAVLVVRRRSDDRLFLIQASNKGLHQPVPLGSGLGAYDLSQ